MPTSNFTAKLLELEDIIISDFTSSNTEIHIHFSLPRKVSTCPHCHMNKVYRDLARDYFPQATIVIDKFHVVRYVTWALENVRKRIQKQLHPEKRKYFKRSRKLLLTRRSKLKEESIDALVLMLSQSEDLATAYHLKELFYDFMKSSSRQEATQKLNFFLLAAQASQLKEFHACLTMLGNWSKYILNAFDCPYTNGFTRCV